MTSNDGTAREFQFTSESVTEGHPDKIADQISDAVLDAVLEQDPLGRVACETLITTGLIVVAGEISTSASLDIQKIARERIRQIGYTRAKYGFDAETCGVIVTLDEQSADIARGVDASFEAQHGNSDAIDGVGAGDQGMMFGYAVNETEELMPLPIVLAHRLARRLAEVRKDGTLDYLRPDGKTQVTVRYEVDEHGHRTPVEIERVLISTQHREGVDAASRIKPDLIEHVIDPILRGDHDHLLDDHRVAGRDFIYVNPTGSFVTGGPMGDTGLTGRKIVVDTYGGSAPHGGGAFSGKDPTKVDRSAAYAARYVAKNVVAAGLAHRCQVQVAYAIGVAHPVSINAECFGTAVIPEARIEELIRTHFDLRPAAIVRDLDLRRPIYTATAAYGHFGRHDLDLSWERTDRAEALRADAGLVSATAGGALGMAVTVVGSVAFDSLETPFGRRERILGGAATHFSLSASMFTDVRVVGVVGDDFGSDELERFHAKGIDTTDLERVPGARSFFWEGRYDEDMQVAHTLETQLNVFAEFDPKLSSAARASSMVFLANIQPDLQRGVREQCGGALLTGLDSMNYWIESARESLLETLAGVDVVMLNDAEVRMLTGEPVLKKAAAMLRAHGPRVLVIKQGSYGSAMSTDEGFFFVPGIPLDTVVDPTGAGDAFAGGFFGYLDSHAEDPFDEAGLRRAAVYGSVMASFAIEGFGSERLESLTHADVVERCGQFHRLTEFDHVAARERIVSV